MSQDQITNPSGLIVMSSILAFTCILAVTLRFWLRNQQNAPLEIDDWLMLPSLVGRA